MRGKSVNNLRVLTADEADLEQARADERERIRAALMARVRGLPWEFPEELKHMESIIAEVCGPQPVKDGTHE